MAGLISSVFCYVKHSENMNVPFPRPFGATGNDARKLHAHGFARFRGVLSAHKVFSLKIFHGKGAQICLFLFLKYASRKGSE